MLLLFILSLHIYFAFNTCQAILVCVGEELVCNADESTFFHCQRECIKYVVGDANTAIVHHNNDNTDANTTASNTDTNSGEMMKVELL